jgi:hypothetical protein
MFDVINLLTGSDAYPPALDSMLSTYLAKAKMRFERVTWTAGNTFAIEDAGEVVTTYEALGDSARLRLLLSPFIYETMDRFAAIPTNETFRGILEAVRAERQIEQERIDDPSCDVVWSSIGDRSIKRVGSSLQTFFGERLDAVVPLDFDSPQAVVVRPSSPLMYLPPEEFSVDERRTAVNKLQKAFAYVETVSPTFAHLIRNYTRAIRLRKSSAVEGFQAEHVTATIGEIRMLNVYKPEFSVERVAESLIHESVHNFLSTYEFLEGPFVLSLDRRQYRPVSTWTGNPIPVASFAHAVFVWFTLFQFAMRELEQPGLTDVQRSEITARRNSYLSGFMAPMKLTDSLKGLGQYSSILFPSIDMMQRVAQDQYSKLNRESAHSPVAA